MTSKLDGRYYISTQAYVETMEFVQAFDHPRHLVIRYESMVQDPEATFREVFSFLDLPFTNTMFDAYRSPSITRDSTKVNQPKVTGEISQNWISRWQDPEHEERIREFDSHPRTHAVIASAGY